jgi:hypothetical protein
LRNIIVFFLKDLLRWVRNFTIDALSGGNIIDSCLMAIAEAADDEIAFNGKTNYSRLPTSKQGDQNGRSDAKSAAS